MVANVTGSSLGAAGTQHLAESGLSASSELIFAPLPHAIPYFIKRSHLPMQVFIRPVNIATGFSWHRFCLFLCYIGGLFSAMLLSLFTYPGESSSLWNISPRHLMRTEPFLSQTWDSYQYPKFPAKVLEQAGRTRRKVWWCVLWERQHPGFEGSKPKNLPVIYL